MTTLNLTPFEATLEVGNAQDFEVSRAISIRVLPPLDQAIVGDDGSLINDFHWNVRIEVGDERKGDEMEKANVGRIGRYVSSRNMVIALVYLATIQFQSLLDCLIARHLPSDIELTMDDLEENVDGALVWSGPVNETIPLTSAQVITRLIAAPVVQA